ncbi:hypothetical protein [Sphingosinicella soli]|uniref:Mg2+/Co2+ transporter CorB n=1 Tax=Sphingosinicella soli TaxID=333708 RepID=A0A7W7F4P4_9SPHN|nr:hypothetical protein [Sphingosinicella soli]MBB4630486.1 Mg2+/Co2+ transporter CorB [Sphingosinicella soli]
MNRVLVTLPLAIVASAFFVSASVTPAHAATGVCAAMPADIRTVADKGDAEAAKKALKLVRTGELLCDAGNERAAKKKFESAYKTLGVAEEEYAQLAK